MKNITAIQCFILFIVMFDFIFGQIPFNPITNKTIVTFYYTSNIQSRFFNKSLSKHEQTVWQFNTLNSDRGGIRNRLNENGINFKFTYKVEALSNLIGGLDQTTSYVDNIDIKTNLDLYKLLKWKSAGILVYIPGSMLRSTEKTPFLRTDLLMNLKPILS